MRRHLRLIGGISGVVGLALACVGIHDWRSIGTFETQLTQPDDVYVGLCSLKPTEIQVLASVADLASTLAFINRAPEEAEGLAALTSATLCATRPGLPPEARLRPDVRVAMEFLVERLWASEALARKGDDFDAAFAAACSYMQNLALLTVQEYAGVVKQLDTENPELSTASLEQVADALAKAGASKAGRLLTVCREQGVSFTDTVRILAAGRELVDCYLRPALEALRGRPLRLLRARPDLGPRLTMTCIGVPLFLEGLSADRDEQTLAKLLGVTARRRFFTGSLATSGHRWEPQHVQTLLGRLEPLATVCRLFLDAVNGSANLSISCAQGAPSWRGRAKFMPRPAPSPVGLAPEEAVRLFLLAESASEPPTPGVRLSLNELLARVEGADEVPVGASVCVAAVETQGLRLKFKAEKPPTLGSLRPIDELGDRLTLRVAREHLGPVEMTSPEELVAGLERSWESADGHTDRTIPWSALAPKSVQLTEVGLTVDLGAGVVAIVDAPGGRARFNCDVPKQLEAQLVRALCEKGKGDSARVFTTGEFVVVRGIDTVRGWIRSGRTYISSGLGVERAIDAERARLAHEMTGLREELGPLAPLTQGGLEAIDVEAVAHELARVRDEDRRRTLDAFLDLALAESRWMRALTPGAVGCALESLKGPIVDRGADALAVRARLFRTELLAARGPADPARPTRAELRGELAHLAIKEWIDRGEVERVIEATLVMPDGRRVHEVVTDERRRLLIWRGMRYEGLRGAQLIASEATIDTATCAGYAWAGKRWADAESGLEVTVHIEALADGEPFRPLRGAGGRPLEGLAVGQAMLEASAVARVVWSKGGQRCSALLTRREGGTFGVSQVSLEGGTVEALLRGRLTPAPSFHLDLFESTRWPDVNALKDGLVLEAALRDFWGTPGPRRLVKEESVGPIAVVYALPHGKSVDDCLKAMADLRLSVGGAYAGYEGLVRDLALELPGGRREPLAMVFEPTPGAACSLTIPVTSLPFQEKGAPVTGMLTCLALPQSLTVTVAGRVRVLGEDVPVQLAASVEPGAGVGDALWKELATQASRAALSHAEQALKSRLDAGMVVRSGRDKLRLVVKTLETRALDLALVGEDLTLPLDAFKLTPPESPLTGILRVSVDHVSIRLPEGEPLRLNRDGQLAGSVHAVTKLRAGLAAMGIDPTKVEVRRAGTSLQVLYEGTQVASAPDTLAGPSVEVVRSVALATRGLRGPFEDAWDAWRRAEPWSAALELAEPVRGIVGDDRLVVVRVSGAILRGLEKTAPIEVGHVRFRTGKPPSFEPPHGTDGNVGAVIRAALQREMVGVSWADGAAIVERFTLLEQAPYGFELTVRARGAAPARERLHLWLDGRLTPAGRTSLRLDPESLARVRDAGVDPSALLDGLLGELTSDGAFDVRAVDVDEGFSLWVGDQELGRYASGATTIAKKTIQQQAADLEKELRASFDAWRKALSLDLETKVSIDGDKLKVRVVPPDQVVEVLKEALRPCAVTVEDKGTINLEVCRSADGRWDGKAPWTGLKLRSRDGKVVDAPGLELRAHAGRIALTSGSWSSVLWFVGRQFANELAASLSEGVVQVDELVPAGDGVLISATVTVQGGTLTLKARWDQTGIHITPGNSVVSTALKRLEELEVLGCRFALAEDPPGSGRYTATSKGALNGKITNIGFRDLTPDLSAAKMELALQELTLGGLLELKDPSLTYSQPDRVVYTTEVWLKKDVLRALAPDMPNDVSLGRATLWWNGSLQATFDAGSLSEVVSRAVSTVLKSHPIKEGDLTLAILSVVVSFEEKAVTLTARGTSNGDIPMALQATVSLNLATGKKEVQFDYQSSLEATILAWVRSKVIDTPFLRITQLEVDATSTPKRITFGFVGELWVLTFGVKDIGLGLDGKFDLSKISEIEFGSAAVVPLGTTPFVLQRVGGAFNIRTYDVRLTASVTVAGLPYLVELRGALRTNLHRMTLIKVRGELVLLMLLKLGECESILDLEALRMTSRLDFGDDRVFALHGTSVVQLPRGGTPWEVTADGRLHVLGVQIAEVKGRADREQLQCDAWCKFLGVDAKASARVRLAALRDPRLALALHLSLDIAEADLRIDADGRLVRVAASAQAPGARVRVKFDVETLGALNPAYVSMKIAEALAPKGVDLSGDPLRGLLNPGKPKVTLGGGEFKPFSSGEPGDEPSNDEGGEDKAPPPSEGAPGEGEPGGSPGDETKPPSDGTKEEPAAPGSGIPSPGTETGKGNEAGPPSTGGGSTESPPAGAGGTVPGKSTEGQGATTETTVAAQVPAVTPAEVARSLKQLVDLRRRLEPLVDADPLDLTTARRTLFYVSLARASLAVLGAEPPIREEDGAWVALDKKLRDKLGKRLRQVYGVVEPPESGDEVELGDLPEADTRALEVEEPDTPVDGGSGDDTTKDRDLPQEAEALKKGLGDREKIALELDKTRLAEDSVLVLLCQEKLGVQGQPLDPKQLGELLLGWLDEEGNLRSGYTNLYQHAYLTLGLAYAWRGYERRQDFRVLLPLAGEGKPTTDLVDLLAKLASGLLARQNGDGGWSYQPGGISDMSCTQAAAFALRTVLEAPDGELDGMLLSRVFRGRNGPEAVREWLDKVRAYVKSCRTGSGRYGYRTTEVGTIDFRGGALVALTPLEIERPSAELWNAAIALARELAKTRPSPTEAAPGDHLFVSLYESLYACRGLWIFLHAFVPANQRKALLQGGELTGLAKDVWGFHAAMLPQLQATLARDGQLPAHAGWRVSSHGQEAMARMTADLLQEDIQRLWDDPALKSIVVRGRR